MVGQIAVPVGGALPGQAAEAAVARASGAMIAARLERLPMTPFQRNIFRFAT